MQYPETEKIRQNLSSQPIIHLAAEVAKTEAFNYEVGLVTWRAASQAVAIVCKLIPENQTAKVRRGLAIAKKHVDSAQLARPNTTLYEDNTYYLRFIQARQQPNETARIQREFHGLVIDRIEKNEVAEKWPFTRTQDRLGKLAELTCVGLISRYAHPAVVALPAVMKHDMGLQVGYKNYDVVVGIS